MCIRDRVRSAPASSCEDDAENDGRETERARRGRRTAASGREPEAKGDD